MKLLQAYVGLGIVWFGCTFGYGDIPGHNKPLGHHRPAEGVLEHLKYFPSPLEFYEKFVSKSKAVVFKGACKDFPATTSWTDEYLKNNYGHVRVRVDQVKVENRSAPSESILLKKFLEIYNKSNVYLVDTLPREMQNDFKMPESLLCGGFTERLQDILIWFSSGKSKSHLHLDTVENINCMISGSKTWFLVDKENTEQIIMDHREGDYCSVNADKVDMQKYPFLQNIPWWNVTVEEGDCIYVPYGWGHQVSSRSRNIAVNVWWTPMMKFNPQNCQDIPSNQTLSSFRFSPGEQYRFLLLKLLQDNKSPVEFKIINGNVLGEHNGKRLISIKDFEILDRNSDGFIGEVEVQELSLQELEQIFDGVEPGEVNINGELTKDTEEPYWKTELDKKATVHEEL